ncbi:hypothetical protein PPYR_08617 [Photinus pyralis]|uniref:Cytochrome P450 n=1 Tax=Photinus pyralis TaxID=7054 RepID=A0A5N4AJZ8_PHOPY|nr:cytochrome P450 6k1-like [Photinus pyralis]KAB0797624.1 hypothetical protein PPYR_08617 [Photinus pyralis]
MIPAFLSFSLNVVLIFVTVSLFLYNYAIRNNDHWKKKGVPYVKPTPIIGNFWDVLTFRISIGGLLTKYYNQFKEPYFGMFILDKPHLIVKGPELIRSILIKDFNYFYDRTVLSDEKCDSLSSSMLFFTKNPEWKYIRNKMTPAFTSGKIKSMFHLIHEAAESLNKYIRRNIDRPSIECKEVCAKYSTDVITSCAFGLEGDSFNNEDAPFRKVGRQMFDFKLSTAIRQTSYFLTPALVKLFRMPFLDRATTDFLRSVFWRTIEDREVGTYKRNDLIDIVRELKKSSGEFKLEGDKVVAQAAQFFAAGFETVSATMSFTLYELCLNHEIQNKLREEIQSTMMQYETMSYEAIQSMKYLHMVVCETLRKYPVLPFLDRMTMSDYKIPNSKTIIEKGTPVYIPLFALHCDPEYFPNPDLFDPERFSSENKSKLQNFVYIPFGDGPRNCIGERFGLITTKMGLVQLLSEFQVERSSDTPVPIKFETKTFLLASDIGLPMKFRKIETH